jgi:hypothetical protein
MPLKRPFYVEPIISTDLKQPNGLSLDVSRGKIYIGDGHYKKIKECNLDGKKCKILFIPKMSTEVENLYVLLNKTTTKLG